MRVWDCDPGVLCNKHLNAQHREIHWAVRCIENNWSTRWKDVERFRNHRDGIQWLGVVHDITVYVLQQRGRYQNHATPGPSLCLGFREFVDDYRTGILGGGSYLSILAGYGYPITQLNQGTPWARDGVSFSWYRFHETDWTRKLAEAAGREHNG